MNFREKLKTKDIVEKVAYGCGDMATSFSYSFAAFFLAIFYTDVFGLPANLVAILMFSYRIIDAANDEFIGMVIDRLSFGRGKYKYNYLLMCVPFAFCTALMYFTPNFGVTGKFIFAFLTVVLWESCFTVINITTSSLLPFLTRDKTERTSFNTFRVALSVLAYLVVGGTGLPLTEALGNGSPQQGYFLTMMFFGAASIPLCLIAYRHINEHGHDSGFKDKSTGQLFALMLGNRRLMILIGAYTLYWAGVSIKNQMLAYFAIYNLGAPGIISMLLFTGIFASLVIQPLIPSLAKTAGRENCMTVGYISAALAILLTFNVSSVAGFVCLNILFGILSAVPSNIIFTIMASFVDESLEDKGVNMSVVIYSTMGLSAKLGMGIAGGLCPMVLHFTHYVPNQAMQSPAALMAIKTLFSGGACLLLLLAGIMMEIFRRRQRAYERR
ncbi:MAG: glycoside-pentoside-hexuronide (GPH):cation symporter [Clostridiales Family XIII bacterium]|jgi:GPH family glycoside/pentoside/hexuronide:cation symporter|nr:glycoside-pentoside-hexuronide (GPH):cation symporter [Clostridiales Family XIII bacterium]